LVTLTCPGSLYHVDQGTGERIHGNSSGIDVWTIDGAEANSRERFFPAVTAALEFPEYFGHNWDATYDCLTDLTGGKDSPSVVLINHGNHFVACMGPDWTTAERVFADTAGFSQGQG
jgi:hypothetical protein